MRLIKSLCFKQHYRQFKQQALDIFNNNVIDNNIPVLKARKRIFNEMKDILSKLKLKHWFSNEKAIS